MSTLCRARLNQKKGLFVAPLRLCAFALKLKIQRQGAESPRRNEDTVPVKLSRLMFNLVTSAELLYKPFNPNSFRIKIRQMGSCPVKPSKTILVKLRARRPRLLCVLASLRPCVKNQESNAKTQSLKGAKSKTWKPPFEPVKIKVDQGRSNRLKVDQGVFKHFLFLGLSRLPSLTSFASVKVFRIKSKLIRLNRT